MEHSTIEFALEISEELQAEPVSELSLEQLSQVGGGVFGANWI